jgi:hypothetical protein
MGFNASAASTPLKTASDIRHVGDWIGLKVNFTFIEKREIS